jgi:hypothetical protein
MERRRLLLETDTANMSIVSRGFDKSQSSTEALLAKILIMLEWQPIAIAPFDHDLQLGVIEQGEVYALVFPCRRTSVGWADATTGKPVLVDPTHWRPWSD